MDVRQINDEYSVSPQIAIEDLEQLQALGFKSIACHRPDNEDPGQPSFAEITARAKAFGIETVHIPISGPPTADAVRAMVDALDELPKPMLGYCRSGNRSTIIYQQTMHLR
ncbi:TIGR01244 family phosphatase [Rhizobium sp. KVB221]|uniref:TIGR01244 family phosphatase n=1 Tax=Rhizobium setariae TaxID=2801340 RepID=A0A936YT23_9HYPH|nr:TIGR01244 family sulfur transferase [Rhizobium setariae]MBL0375303.1 TIGR01244 family phosphatase [Rhizobium setariae]